jgi:large subunit ribosomal protein L17
MLSNMATSLILHKRISTTLAKAKELKKYLEPLVTRAKEDTTHNRRMTFSYLRSKEAIIELFGGIIEKVATRPGGYTRIIKTGFRLGDNAEMCIIELVDYNELMLKDSKPAKKTTRRSRRGTGTAVAVATETDTDVVTNGEGIAEEPSAPEASEDSTKEETDNK